jgi:hypothetical protein
MSELQIVGVFDLKSSRGNFRFQFSVRRVAAVPLMCLMLAACTPEKATVRLKDDFQVGTVSIIHARFPCHSPDLHFFGYRFRVDAKQKFVYGDICWDLLSGKWTWSVLPEYISSPQELEQWRRAD